MSRFNKLLLCLCFWLPVLVVGQSPASTSTTSRSVGTGTTNALFVSTSVAIGPGQIAIGDRGTCSISGPPYPSCVPSGGGTGTPADPFGYTCHDLPLNNCSLGTPFVVLAGTDNTNIHTHRQTVAVPGVNTTSQTRSVGLGATNADFSAVTLTVGPGQLVTGDRGTCSIPPPPYATCTLTGGTGTTSDPFSYSCPAGLPLTNCSLPGTTLVVASGNSNIDTLIHRQTAVAVVPVAAPAAGVPFGPWVPISSGLGVALLATLALRRRKR